MNLQFSPLFGVSLLFLMAQADADTVLLKNGKSHEGKVIFQDDTSCLLEVEYSKGILEEKKFLKSDIKSITLETPDIGEFKKLKTLVSVPDLLGAADYEQRLKIVEDFINDFPRSEKLKEAKTIQESLKKEFEVVRAGGMKLSGKMVTVEDYMASAYAYDQKIAVQKIYRDMLNRNFLGALRLFSDYESKFPNGKSRVELVLKIKQVLIFYQSSLNESLAGYDARMRLREVGLARMLNEDRMVTQQALDEQMVHLKSRFELEKTMKNYWVTPDAYYKDSMVEALRQVDAEIKRLNSPSKATSETVSLEDSYSEAWKKLPGASVQAQKAIIEKLKRERMPESYIKILKGRSSPEQ
jgi:hypothetical protein